MSGFYVENTIVAKSLTNITNSDEWIPIVTSPNNTNEVAFNNIEVVCGFYSRVGSVVNFNVKFTADISAAITDTAGIINIAPPVYNFDDTFVVGQMLTIDQEGLYGVMTNIGNVLQVDVRNDAGVISASDVFLTVMGSYKIDE